MTTSLFSALCVTILSASVGCLDARSIACGDGWCPVGTLCAENGAQGARCVSQAQLSACEGKKEKETCVLAGASSARCVGGACTPVVCGDGIVAGDEVCDDNNARSCDGCSSDCRSDERCGNGLVDCSEQCDEGEENQNAPNVACRTDCQRQRCGDGIVDALSGEDCDGAANQDATCEAYDYYGGVIGCSATCRNDTSQCAQFCGDGVVNGIELCDGENPASGETCLDFGYDVGNLTCGSGCVSSYARCEQTGFRLMNTGPDTLNVFSLWGSGASNVYATGDRFVYHYDGAAWSPVDLSALPRAAENLWLGIWGSGPKNVFVVGLDGLILHSDGADWSLMDSGTTESLSAIWGAGPDDVFAVGDGGTVLHFDGTSWSPMVDSSGGTGDFSSIWGVSHDEVFAVREESVLHFDGSEWTAMVVPSTEALNRVWGASATDVHVVGDQGTLLHYDGNVWTNVSTSITQPLHGIWGSSATDVYAGGPAGTLLHYDGKAWTPEPVSTAQGAWTLWGSGSDDIFAGDIGVTHRGQGGPTFRPMTSNTTAYFLKLWVTSDSDVTAVGENGTIAQFDGTAWSTVPSPLSTDLNTVWGADAQHLFAAGSEGTIVGRTGGMWSVMPSPAVSGELISIWGSGPSDVYAVGQGGAFLHYDGTSWSSGDSPTDEDLSAVWGTGTSELWVSGPGLLFRRVGTMWEPLPVGESGTATTAATTMWGPGQGRVFVGADADLFVVDGDAVRPTRFAQGSLVTVVTGTSSTDVFALGAGASQLFHYDGSDWAPIRLPNGVNELLGISMSMRHGYLVGISGTIVEVDRNCAANEKNCNDRWDNDCDGLLNCADPDCAGNTSCHAGGACSSVRTALQCGSEVSATTAATSPNFSTYPCSPRAEHGREVYYRFEATKPGPVSVTLDDMNGVDLDLIVLGATPSGACDTAGACLSASSTTAASEHLTFDALTGATYYVVVEGYEDAFGSFSLKVACP